MKSLLLLLLLTACGQSDSVPGPESWQLKISESQSLEMVALEVSGEKIWMAKTEIPWEVFDLFFLRPDEDMEMDGITGPSKSVFPVTRGFGHNGMPALGMTLNSAESFCRWLSLRTGHEYRLPTEAEWLAGVGKAPTPLNDYAWSADNAGYVPHAVGSAKVNAQGFHDLLGNLGEWCHDNAGEGVVCGGSYLEAAADVTPEFRQRYKITWQNRDPQFPKSSWWMSDCGWVGFRIATTQKPESR